MSPKKILVVDDEHDLREALKTALGYEGFDVHAAADGEEGLRIALQEHPDLMLLDIAMPKKDGLTLLQELRDDAWGKTAKVIVLTAYDDLEKVAEIVAAGGDEYIVKTKITLSAIVEKVKKNLTPS